MEALTHLLARQACRDARECSTSRLGNAAAALLATPVASVAHAIERIGEHPGSSRQTLIAQLLEAL